MSTMLDYRNQPNFACWADTALDSWTISARIQHNRDSDHLTESNWDTVIAALEADCGTEAMDPSEYLDGSNGGVLLSLYGGSGWQIQRAGHWACGWVELLIAAPGSKAEDLIAQFEEQLSDYPVLDEEDFSNREYEDSMQGLTEELERLGYPDDRAGDVFSWLWNNDSGAVECGNWPSAESVTAACEALGIESEDSE